MPADTTCPICGKAADPLHEPFCSRGCKDRDLLQWLGEGYRLPGAAIDDEAGPDGLDSGVDKGGEHP